MSFVKTNVALHWALLTLLALSNLLIMSVHDDGYFKNESCTLTYNIYTKKKVKHPMLFFEMTTDTTSITRLLTRQSQ